LGRFCAATPRCARAAPHGRWPPFSRSYGVMLPSSLAKVPPFTSAAFCQPTSVGLRYGRRGRSLGAFLGGSGATPSRARRRARSRRPSGLARPDFPGRAPYGRRRAMSTARRACPPPRPPVAQARPAGAGILTCSPIGCALRPRLRPDSPWADHPAPGTLGLPVARILTALSRYSFRHSHSAPLHPRSRSGFPGGADAPLPPASPRVRGFGAGLQPRYILGARPLDQ
jgi:hypothetical protein